jgi:hypothetical protein
VNAFEGLPDELTLLVVADQRHSKVPEWIASLPGLTKSLINMSQEENLDNASPWCFLDIIGLPRSGGARIRIDPSELPDADDLRPFLFPSVLAATVDERRYRLSSRGAFPLALLANETILKFSLGFGWTLEEGFRIDENLNLSIFGFDPTAW